MAKLGMSVSVTVDRPLHALSSPVGVMVRRRMLISLALGAVALVFGSVLVAAFGWEALAVYVYPLTVGLILLWASSDVVRSDEIHSFARPRA